MIDNFLEIYSRLGADNLELQEGVYSTGIDFIDPLMKLLVTLQPCSLGARTRERMVQQ